MPGASVEVVGGQALTAGGEPTLPVSYDVPWDVVPGTNQTSVEFLFQFAGNGRSLQVGYHNAEGLWAAARDPNILAVSDWVVAAMAFLVLIAVTIVVLRERRNVAAQASQHAANGASGRSAACQHPNRFLLPWLHASWTYPSKANHASPDTL